MKVKEIMPEIINAVADVLADHDISAPVLIMIMDEDGAEFATNMTHELAEQAMRLFSKNLD